MTTAYPTIEPSLYLPDAPHELRCPFCDDYYVHIEVNRVETHVTDDYTAPIGTRGSWVAVLAWCESGHAWKLVLGFHKGMTFVGVADDPEGERWLSDDRAA